MVEEGKKLGNDYKKLSYEKIKKSPPLTHYNNYLLSVAHVTSYRKNVYNHPRDLELYLTIAFINLLPNWLKELR